MPDEKPDLSDASLEAMDDTTLLETVEALGLDTAGIDSREAALAAIKAKRDGDAPQGGEGATDPVVQAIAEATGVDPASLNTDPAAPPASVPAEAEVPNIDTRADATDQRYERPRFSAIVNDAVRAAAGNPGLHAVLHKFEVALADFRRTADLVGEDPALDQDSEVANLVRDIRRFF
jgi:hypothetical protein